MKNLVLSTLIAAAATSSAGCFFESDDGGGNVSLAWSLKSTNAGQIAGGVSSNPDIAAACPPGADTARLFALSTFGGLPFEDKFDCIDGRGEIADLEPGEYDVWIQLSDFVGATKFAESFSQRVQVRSGAVTPTTQA